MLRTLSIHNVLLIEQLTLEFQKGFSIFSGETGAGKSILLESLTLALGGRADSNWIRQGASAATVTAIFDIVLKSSDSNATTHSMSTGSEVLSLLREQGIIAAEDIPTEDIPGGIPSTENILADLASPEVLLAEIFSTEVPVGGLSLPLALTEEIVLRRTIYPDGRSKAFINDHPVSVGLLKKVGQRLIEIHGQFDQLLDPASHRRVLDDFGDHFTLKEEMKKFYCSWQERERLLLQHRQQQQQLFDQESYIRQMVEELELLNPQEGEETSLVSQKALQSNYQKITNSLKGAEAFLLNDNNLYQAQRILSKLLSDPAIQETEWDEKEVIEKTIKSLDTALYEREEALGFLQSLDKGGNLNSLEEIEERLHQIRATARKHRCIPDALPAVYQRLKEELNRMENTDKLLHSLEKDRQHYRNLYQEKAVLLQKARQRAAQALEEKVQQELPLLKLPHARFKVKIESLQEEQWNETGQETIEFMVQTNPDTPFGGLGKIASGGELARFMLAIKVALAGKGSVPTLVFDEIDGGTGGAVAAALGNRLKCLSQHLQLLVITHSPQVAALATHHFYVSKMVHQGKTMTTIQHLDFEQRKEEIARMLSGEKITDQAREAALRLLSES